MSWYSYSDAEKAVNAVLKNQNKALGEIGSSRLDTTGIEERISKSESLLIKLGYKLPEVKAVAMTENMRAITIPSWEEVSSKALAEEGEECELEKLFTAEELAENREAVRIINEEFNQVHRFDPTDVAVCASAGIISGIVDVLLTGLPDKTANGIKAGSLSDFIRDYFEKRYPNEDMERLANSKISKVPYDAQDNRNITKKVEGLSAYYHRLLSLGHDPLLGLVIGVADILNGTMTTIDKKGNIIVQVTECYAERTEADVFSALAKQICHFVSDINTSMGLPVPLMGLFNLIQIGSFGKYEQTIAEIVQGMYYEGYDFVHFCSMSVPVMITEVVVRLGYAFKRIHEGYDIKKSIPASLNREKHPKLATMLFTAHSAAAAINAGKIYFTRNPTAINYPQWIAFAKYSYQQLKWILLVKPEIRDRYVRSIISQESDMLYETVNESFLTLEDGAVWLD